MLTVTQLPTGQLGIRCDYYYRNRISNIPTARFDYDNKLWIIESFALGSLENEFNNSENGLELVYNTPRWVILNQPIPDMSNMYKIHNHDIDIPAMKLNLYDYQKYGVKFSIDKILKYNFCLIADSVGIGKTAQAIGCFKWFIENKNAKKILIVCKKSAKDQWYSEIKKFTNLDNEFWIDYSLGTPKKRQKTYEEFFNADKGILIVNHHTFLNDTQYFLNQDIDFAVVDEVHSVKCRTGKINGNMRLVLKDVPTLFLTGTPIMSNPEDIFGILQISDPDYLGQWTAFKKRYIVEANGNFGWHTVGAKHLDELRDKLQEIIIRRTEYEVSIDLPEVRIQKMSIQMDDTQIKLLTAIEENLEKVLSDINNIKAKAKNEFNESTKLGLLKKAEILEGFSKGFISAKQVACTDPRIFALSNSKNFRDMYTNIVPKSYKMSNKTEAILDLVQDILSDNKKVILFSKYRTTAVQIMEDIKKNLKENVLLYTGSENEEERIIARKLFTDTLDHNILIGTDAMSESLNLQVAKYVINIDQPDTCAIKVQRLGRVRRAGSTFKDVVIYDMITEDSGDIKSKDEERLKNIQKNQDLSGALIDIDESQRIALINAMKEEV